MSDNVFKIWGTRRRMLLTIRTEIDLLHIKKNSFCSTHSHEFKINRFFVVSGKVKIETDYGHKTLTANESWTVEPPRVHRFIALEDSVVVEMAFIFPEDSQIIPDDIKRISQGGRIIDGKEKTLEELEKEGKLDL